APHPQTFPAPQHSPTVRGLYDNPLSFGAPGAPPAADGPQASVQGSGPGKNAHSAKMEALSDDEDDDDGDERKRQQEKRDILAASGRTPENAPKPPEGALHPSMGSEGHEEATCKRC
ncbi:unnamed protein product, partial [Polarella glacialis]